MRILTPSDQNVSPSTTQLVPGSAWQSWGHQPPPMPERGYAALCQRHVLQADRGCDFDFLVGV
jgi:hypothetical protein